MSTDTRPPFSVVKVPIRNRRKSAVKLRLEPWGEQFDIEPGSAVQVVGRGPEGDSIEVVWDAAGVTVFGWPGSVVSILRKGVDLGAAAGARRAERANAPRLPTGMRVREWVAEMVG